MVLDACVLVPISLCDVLLNLADAGLLDPLWSDSILAETRRALIEKRGVDPIRAESRLNQMTSAYPHAAVTGFESLIPRMANHPKDRHVLAVAVHSRSDVIVTANIKDFPPGALKPYGIKAVRPSNFLMGLLRADPTSVEHVICRQVARYKNPPMTMAEFAAVLAPLVPGFAQRLADNAEHRDPPPGSAPRNGPQVVLPPPG